MNVKRAHTQTYESLKAIEVIVYGKNNVCNITVINNAYGLSSLKLSKRVNMIKALISEGKGPTIKT